MQCINLEGVDKVGKHTATIATIEVLLHSDYDVLMLDAPQYWFFGAVLRKALNTENFEVEAKREIELRAILYIIDRLLSFIAIIPYIHNHPDAIVVADRGWASNAVTAGFGLAQGKIQEHDLAVFLQQLTEWEQEYINFFQPKSILLHTGKNGKSAMEKGTREREDLYEQPEPQIQALKVYQQYLQLPEIHTQHNGVWKNKYDIAHEILEIAGIPHIKQISADEHNTIDYKQDNLYIVGPKTFFPIIYGREWDGIKEILSDRLERIDAATLSGDKDTLKVLENEISTVIFNAPPSDIYCNVPQIVKNGLQRNLLQNQELKHIIIHAAGENFYRYIEQLLA